MHRVQTHTAWLKYFFKALYGVLLRASSASVRACASYTNIHKNGQFCVYLCVFGKGKNSILIFPTYPSIFSYQSFRKWKRMSNLPPAMFLGLWNTSKRFFRSKSEKMTFPTVFHRASLGAPVHNDIFECCFCCLKKQHMLPKISDLVKEGLRSL